MEDGRFRLAAVGTTRGLGAEAVDVTRARPPAYAGIMIGFVTKRVSASSLVNTIRETPQSVDAANDCLPPTSRLFVSDRKTKVQFLVDTGSDVCVLPRSYLRERRSPANYTLTAANGSLINTYGTSKLHLDFGLRRDFA